MKRGIWFAVAAGVVIAIGLTLLALPRGPEWTTSSPEALAEFEAGAEAQSKVYFKDAQKHFERAYELDPEFVIAKWRYAGLLHDENPELAEKFFDELMAVDISGLNPRERFFIERWRANRDGRPEDAVRLLDEYLERYPDDPQVLSQKAGVAWFGGDLEEAERLYQHLLEISPNRVAAYNSLGYISMMQGRFTESEEYFKSYRFIAPDQANPHDSLGELFITVGRYDEAEESLERAIEIKPDFWASYEHLALMRMVTGEFDGAREIIERARAAGMPDDALFQLDCLANYHEMKRSMAWRRILDERDSECVKGFRVGFAAVATHLAASRVGDWETAYAIEDEAAGMLLTFERNGDDRTTLLFRSVISHMQGVRLAIQGELGVAEKRFGAADDGLTYMEAGTGRSKLTNRLLLVETLLAGGKDVDAHELLAEVRSVNPAVAEDFEDSGFRVLGLDRG